MNRDAEIVRRLFSRYDPARDVLGDDEIYLASAQRITGLPVQTRLHNDRPGGVTRRSLLARIAVVSAAGVIAAGGVAVLYRASEPPASVPAATPVLLSFRAGGTTLTAHEVLLKTAASAERQPDKAGAGRYQYVETQGWYLDTAVSDRAARSAVVPAITRQWTATDGSGRISTESGKPYFPSARSRRAWQDDGGFDRIPRASDKTFGPGSLHLMWQPGALSGDQAVLRRQLEIGHPAELGPAETLVAVSDLYREQPVIPAVRGAILRIIATLPGLRYDGTTIDRAGRRGIGVSVDSNLSGLPTRYIMIFDPVTGQLLGSEQVLTTTAGKLDVPVPSLIACTVYLNSGRTDDLDLPGGAART